MHIDQITANLAEHNLAQARPVRKSKPKPKAAQGFAGDDQLRVITARIVAALGLESRGVTVEDVVRHVQACENAAYQGTVQ